MKQFLNGLIGLATMIVAATIIIIGLLFIWGSVIAVFLGCIALIPVCLILVGFFGACEWISSFRHERWMNRRLKNHQRAMATLRGEKQAK